MYFFCRHFNFIVDLIISSSHHLSSSLSANQKIFRLWMGGRTFPPELVLHFTSRDPKFLNLSSIPPFGIISLQQAIAAVDCILWDRRLACFLLEIGLIILGLVLFAVLFMNLPVTFLATFGTVILRFTGRTF
jgi:hypothetical protein